MDRFTQTDNTQKSAPTPQQSEDPWQKAAADLFKPPAPARPDDTRPTDRQQAPGERQSMPGDRQTTPIDPRQQRRERLGNLLDRVQQAGGLAGILRQLDGVLGGIDGTGETRDKVRQFMDFISDVKGVRLGRDVGKIKIDIERNNASKVDVNRKQGPVNVQSIDLADKISFKVNRVDGTMKLEDIQGLRVNAQFDAGPIKKDMKVDVRTATLDKKDNKPILKVEVSPPGTNLKLPIEVPLERPKK